MLIGLGLSDISREYHGNLSAVEKERLSALELQPELNSWKGYPLKARYGFLSVHASAQGRDIASPDDAHRAFALKETEKAMSFAQEIGADAFLLHAGHIFSPANVAGITERPDYPYDLAYYTAKPEERQLRADLFLDSLAQLTNYYLEQGCRFTITIENLPFPNLGATPAEYASLFRRARSIWPVLMTIDIPHFWVSRQTLTRNHSLHERIEGYPNPSIDFYAELSSFLEKHDSDILYFHLSGVVGRKEHGPIGLKRQYHSNELNLKRVSMLIDHRHPVILEIFNYPQATVLRSLHNFTALALAA